MEWRGGIGDWKERGKRFRTENVEILLQWCSSSLCNLVAVGSAQWHLCVAVAVEKVVLMAEDSSGIKVCSDTGL